MTIASDAMADFKKRVIGFRRKFPLLPPEVDEDIRKAYRGGFTWVNDVNKEKEVGAGLTLDVNSLYPSCMHSPNLLPYGEPVFFEGKYKEDKVMPLYVQSISCSFEIKPGKIPSIQLRNNMSFVPNEYVTSSRGEIVNLVLTKPDLELFFEQYNVRLPKYNGGWKFKAAAGLFDEYIDYWTEQKIQAGKEGNAPLRQLSKLMLNSLYGRFGISGKAKQKMPYLDEDGIVKFIVLPEETRQTCYIPVAVWTTSLGRSKTIRTAQAIRDYTIEKYGIDKMCYCDTDSCHANLTQEDLKELKDIIQIDDYALGFWSWEASWQRGCFIRQKCYIEEIDGKVHATIAGMPKYLEPLVTFENFKRGFSTTNMTLNDMIKLAKENGASSEEPPILPGCPLPARRRASAPSRRRCWKIATGHFTIPPTPCSA